MGDDFIDIRCPNCSAPCIAEIVQRMEAPPSWTREYQEVEVTCECCAWEFMVDSSATITNDGEIDADPVLAMSDDGDVVDAGCHAVRCSRCNRAMVDEDAGAAECPWCRGTFMVGAEAPRPVERIWESGYDGYPLDTMIAEIDEPDWIPQCPTCGPWYFDESSDFCPLQDGWLICHGCGSHFHDRKTFQSLLHLYEQARRHHREITVSPAGASRDLYAPGNDFLRVTVQPGEYSVYALPTPRIGMTLRSAGPEHTRITDRCKLNAPETTFIGVTFLNGVTVGFGNVTLVDCVVLSKSGPAIEVDGSSTHVVMKNCKIGNAAAAGVRIANGATVRMHGCDIRSSAGPAIQLEGGCSLRLRRTRITGNGNGIVAGWNDQVFVRDCWLEDNGPSALSLDGSQAVLTRTTIMGQHHDGIHAIGDAQAILRRSEVTGCIETGLSFVQNSKLAASRCSVRTCGELGVRIEKSARALLSKCDIASNGTGIQLAERSRLRLRQSRLIENRRDWNVDGNCQIVMDAQ